MGRKGRHGGCGPVGLGVLCFVAGIFTAMILPVTLLVVLEGGLIIVLGITLIRR